LSKPEVKTAKAFAPAGISSFFEICDTVNGKPIIDLELVGARGGGFGLQKGVWTQVTVEESKSSGITVFINGKSSASLRAKAVVNAPPALVPKPVPMGTSTLWSTITT